MGSNAKLGAQALVEAQMFGWGAGAPSPAPFWLRTWTASHHATHTATGTKLKLC